MFQLCGEIDLLPTTFRPVSGTVSVYDTRKPPATMTRNQEMVLHPRNCQRIPPMSGPKAGATIIPTPTIPMYLPRSEVIETSATTPYARQKKPLLPILCIQRSMNSAAQLFYKAKPMFAPMYIVKARIYAGLLPVISARSPKNMGAHRQKMRTYELQHIIVGLPAPDRVQVSDAATSSPMQAHCYKPKLNYDDPTNRILEDTFVAC